MHKRNYQTNFSNVVLDDVEVIQPFRINQWRLGDNFLEHLQFNKVYIKLPAKGSEPATFVEANLIDPILREPTITESGKVGTKTVGKVKGILYAVIERMSADTLPNTPVYSSTSQSSPTQPASSTGTSNGDSDSGRSSNWWSTDWLSGCFSAVLWILLALFLLSLIMQGAPWLLSLLKILLILFGIYLLFRLLGSLLRVLSGILSFVLTFVGILALLSYLFSHANYQDNDQAIPKEEKAETSKMKSDTSLVEPDSVTGTKNPLVMIHHRKWVDFTPQRYEGDLMMSQQNYFLSRQYREGLQPNSYDFMQQFHQVYDLLASKDENNMHWIYQLFDSLRVTNRLTDAKFAEMIVTCVQDIPYRLIIDTPNRLDGRMLNYYRQYGALEHIKFGVQAPVEFMYNLQGDCDTRALFCYTVLEHYGYDVAILISEYYSHALLGLAIPSTGQGLTYRGKRYYAWETTAKGFQLGQLSPEIGNMDYWRLILVSNNN